MQAFMNENFLLKTETAQRLFHQYAKDMPIFDYHCHISPKEIWENIGYENITQVWLYGDHYKWRIMRAVGIDEKYITGDGTDYEKFVAYAKALSQAIGNPLYHWSHLELRRYFGVEEIINEENAPVIWEKANAKLKDLRCRDLIAMSNVKLIGTTDDPIDTLEYHQKLQADPTMTTKVVPSFRPDNAVEINKDGYAAYIGKLSAASGIEIQDFQSLKAALADRVEFFHANGCRVSDHGLDYAPYAEATEDEINHIMKKALAGEKVSADEREKYRTAVLLVVAELYASHGWVMQLHMAAIRNNNSKLFAKLGPDVGNDAIMDVDLAANTAALLDAMNNTGSIPKTILYSLNPVHNYMLHTIGGCFAGDIPGKIQLGSAWWFNDHIDGMREQIRTYANVGVLGQFIGMLTDSRSFLSYFRHEYFRRILCNEIGNWVEDGEYPCDEDRLKQIVQGICYNNAVSYFNIEL